MKVIKSSVVLFLIIVVASIILKWDACSFLLWWGAYLITGIIFMPFTQKIFHRFYDKGYLFSKIIGVVVPAYVIWVFSTFKIVPFYRTTIVLIYIVALAIVLLASKGYAAFIGLFKDSKRANFIIYEEGLFLACMAFWAFLRGLRPEISGGKFGLEKFMDFGFVNASLVTKYMPPTDIWFAGKNINYYYFGHYITAFMTKLTGIPSSITYNLMIASVFGFVFALSFSLIFNVVFNWDSNKFKRAVTAGLISACLVSLGGNLHTIMFTTIFPMAKAIDIVPSEIFVRGEYWFPEATRYIGHNPETEDKTIHEFPMYSFVMADLHAHMTNIQFVVTILALIWLFLCEAMERAKKKDEELPFWRDKSFVDGLNDLRDLKSLLALVNRGIRKVPIELWMISFFVGIFHMSNYSDFPIYMTVAFFVVVYISALKYGASVDCLIHCLILCGFVVLVSTLVAMPFMKDTVIFTNGISFVKYTSKFYQLLIVWGYQLFFAIYFMRYVFFTERKFVLRDKGNKTRNVKDGGGKNLNNTGIKSNAKRIAERRNSKFGNTDRMMEILKRIFDFLPSDAYVFILFICAIGLVIVPEIVYVKDIYGGGDSRSNTMFKLTYQAFIMFALSCGYVSVRIFSIKRDVIKSFCLMCAVIMFIAFPMMYAPYAISQWFGNSFQEGYKGLDGVEAYFDVNLSDDLKAIKWLKGQKFDKPPVIMEAFGDSYTDYGRISVATGFPTIMGWGSHEWLWRSSNEECFSRMRDVGMAYESDDLEGTKAFLDKYHVKYIIIGNLEREKFKNLNESKLLKLGKLTFKSWGTEVLEVF